LGSEGIAPGVINFGIRWRSVANFMPRPLYPWGKRQRHPEPAWNGGNDRKHPTVQITEHIS